MKINYIIYLFLTVFVGVITSIVGVGCADQYANLKIELNTTELEFNLDGEEEAQTEADIVATVAGASGDVVSGLILELSDNTVASASVIKADKNKYTIRVVAKGAGETRLTIKAKESAKVRYDDFAIVVKKIAETVAVSNQKYAINRGGELKLSLEEMLRVTPQRIYPAVANFSILPTPDEVASNADWTNEEKNVGIIGLEDLSHHYQ